MKIICNSPRGLVVVGVTPYPQQKLIPTIIILLSVCPHLVIRNAGVLYLHGHRFVPLCLTLSCVLLGKDLEGL